MGTKGPRQIVWRTVVPGAEICVPYSNDAQVRGDASNALGGFLEPEGFQIISAGMDGVYGEEWPENRLDDQGLPDVIRFRRTNEFLERVYPATALAPGEWDDGTDLNTFHNDNLASFFEGRLDANRN